MEQLTPTAGTVGLCGVIAPNMATFSAVNVDRQGPGGSHWHKVHCLSKPEASFESGHAHLERCDRLAGSLTYESW